MCDELYPLSSHFMERAMKRREFMTSISAVVVSPLAVRAQTKKLWRIAHIIVGSPDITKPITDAFVRTLAEAGYENGKNINLNNSYIAPQLAAMVEAIPMLTSDADLLAIWGTVGAVAAKKLVPQSEGRARHECDRAPEWRLLPEGNSNRPQIYKRILPHVGNVADGHGDLAAVVRDDQGSAIELDPLQSRARQQEEGGTDRPRRSELPPHRLRLAAEEHANRPKTEPAEPNGREDELVEEGQ
jgi:hypothetical protein